MKSYLKDFWKKYKSQIITGIICIFIGVNIGSRGQQYFYKKSIEDRLLNTLEKGFNR